MKKRRWYLTSLMLCAVLLAGCGQKKAAEETKKNDKKIEETTQLEVETKTKTDTAEDEVKAVAEKFKDRKSEDLGFFKVYYPDSWKFDADSERKEESYAQVTFFEGESKDSASHQVYLSATNEDAYTYRKELNANGIDLKACAEGKLDTVKIGNVDCIEYQIVNTDKYIYRYRHEPSGISYTFRVNKGYGDKEIDELFEGIWLELKDEGNKDAPWPWEGEPFQPELKEQMVGAYTIVPEYIPFEESQGIFEIMEHKFYKQGDQLFHLLEDKLDNYEYSVDVLKYVSTLELEGECEYISADSSGMLYLSRGIPEIFGVKDGKKALQTTVKGDLSMHSSGEWGITFWVNSDAQKVTNQGGVLTAEPWILTGLNDDATRKGPFSMLDNVQVTDQHILVAGKTAGEDSNTKIMVYDYDGNQLLELGGTEISDRDVLGYITGMAETENGFVATDGNMRRIQFWNKEGVHVGDIETKDIFGTGYPWLEDMQLLEDGSILIMVTQEREDKSANELMLFRLTGF